MSDIIRGNPTPIDSVVVQIPLSVGHMNYILAVLAKRPLEESIDAFSALKNGGEARIRALQQQAAPAAPATPPGDKPAAPSTPAGEPAAPAAPAANGADAG